MHIVILRLVWGFFNLFEILSYNIQILQFIFLTILIVYLPFLFF